MDDEARYSVRCRLTAGHCPVKAVIGVRIPAPELHSRRPLPGPLALHRRNGHMTHTGQPVRAAAQRCPAVGPRTPSQGQRWASPPARLPHRGGRRPRPEAKSTAAIAVTPRSSIAVPSSRFGGSGERHRWPRDVVLAASMAHRCGGTSAGSRIGGTSLRPAGHYGRFIPAAGRCRAGPAVGPVQCRAGARAGAGRCRRGGTYIRSVAQRQSGGSTYRCAQVRVLPDRLRTNRKAEEPGCEPGRCGFESRRPPGSARWQSGPRHRTRSHGRGEKMPLSEGGGAGSSPAGSTLNPLPAVARHRYDGILL